MKGKRIKVKNKEELQEILKRERKDNVGIKLIFLNLIAGDINFEKACRFCGKWNRQDMLFSLKTWKKFTFFRGV